MSKTSDTKGFGQFKKELPKPVAKVDLDEISKLAEQEDGFEQPADFNIEELAKQIEEMSVELPQEEIDKDLFEEVKVLTPEESQRVLEQTLAALTGTRKPRLPDPDVVGRDIITTQPLYDADRRSAQYLRQKEYLDSMPPHVMSALKDLAMMLYGEDRVDAMLTFKNFKECQERIQAIMYLDLARIWKGYADA